jgi:quercetin 2,3-dioxygenase
MGPVSGLDGRRLGEDFVVKDGWRMYHGKKVPGFPGHPHMGFETITVVREGFVDHSDSLGAAGRYGNGDVQWMTAGKGVQHSEMFPLINADKPNKLELFQIWLNLPAASKKTDPHFTMLWADKVPTLNHTDGNGKSTQIVIQAGHYGDKITSAIPPASWAANVDHQVAVINIKLDPGAIYTIPSTPTGVNRSLYCFKGGNIRIGETTLQTGYGAELAHGMAIEIQNGDEVTELLLLQGKAIGEPVVQHGPFVGNSRNDIQQAFVEYNKNQFGGWPWPEYEYVHPRNKGRFALYPGGREETPE